MTRNRNVVLRSLAKTSKSFEAYVSFVEKYAADTLTYIDDIDLILGGYWRKYQGVDPMEYKTVAFTQHELDSISLLQNKYSRYINLGLLYIFKYFSTDAVKVPFSDLRILMGLAKKRSLREVEFLSCIKRKYYQPQNSNLDGYKRLKPVVFKYYAQSLPKVNRGYVMPVNIKQQFEKAIERFGKEICFISDGAIVFCK